MQSLYDSLSKSVSDFEERNKATVGYIWALLSACFMSLSSYFVKKVPSHVSSSEILLYRSVQLSIYTYIFMLLQKSEFHFKHIEVNRVLIQRALAGVIGMALTYYGLTLLPLSDAVVIMQTYPVPTGLFAYYLIGEKYDSSQFLAAIICLVGVGLIAQPAFIFGEHVVSQGDNGTRILGTMTLALSTIFIALSQVLIRKAGAMTNVGITTLYFSHGSTIIGAVLCLFQGFSSFDLYTAIQLFWVAITIFVGQITRNRSFMLINAGPASIMGYFGILFAYVMDIFLLGTKVNFYSLTGAICIFSCMFLYLHQIIKKESHAKK